MRRLNTNSWPLHPPQDPCSWPLLQTMHFWDHDLFCCCLEVPEEQYVSLPTAPPPAPSSFQAPHAESARGLHCSGASASSVSGNFKASHIQKQGDAWDRLLAPSMGARQRKVDQRSRYCSDSLTLWRLLCAVPFHLNNCVLCVCSLENFSIAFSGLSTTFTFVILFVRSQAVILWSWRGSQHFSSNIWVPRSPVSLL